LNGPIGCFIRQKKADRAFVNEDERLAMFAPAGIENSQNAGSTSKNINAAGDNARRR
jgi:hypothetical protein